MLARDTHAFDRVRLRNGLGVIEPSLAVHMPPDDDEFRAATRHDPGRTIHFHVVETPEPVAVLTFSNELRFPGPDEERVSTQLLSAGLSAVVWLKHDGPGTAVAYCVGSSELTVQRAACALWGLKMLGAWDETPTMAFQLSRFSLQRDPESRDVVQCQGVGYFVARGLRYDHPSGWSVEVCTTPILWAALHRLCEAAASPMLIAANVDGTKVYNDAYGHEQADGMLARIHAAADNIAREFGGVLTQTGGDEFVILIDSSRPEAGMECAQALEQAVRDMNIISEHPQVPTLGRITLSIGVLALHRALEETQLRERVESALYEAKKAGRNTIHITE